MAYFEVNTIPYDVQQVMAIYNANNEDGTRLGLIAVLEEMRGYLTTDNDADKVLKEHTDAALKLLREMTDAQFDMLDLTVDFPS